MTITVIAFFHAVITVRNKPLFQQAEKCPTTVFRNPISRQSTKENHISAPKPINHINQSISQEGKDHEQKAGTADFRLLQHHRQIYP